jgi:hypothetical protein
VFIPAFAIFLWKSHERFLRAYALLVISVIFFTKVRSGFVLLVRRRVILVGPVIPKLL